MPPEKDDDAASAASDNSAGYSAFLASLKKPSSNGPTVTRHTLEDSCRSSDVDSDYEKFVASINGAAAPEAAAATGIVLFDGGKDVTTTDNGEAFAGEGGVTKADVYDGGEDGGDGGERGGEEVGPDEIKNGFLQRVSRRVARRPGTVLCFNAVVAIILSAIGLIVGEFSISTNQGGWQSRGTVIGNRQAQALLTRRNQEDLFYGGDEVWNEMIENVQPGWEDLETVDASNSRRRLSTHFWRRHSAPIPLDLAAPVGEKGVADALRPRAWTNLGGEDIAGGANQGNYIRKIPFELTPDHQRKLQAELLEDGCDISWYLDSDRLLREAHLWPVWKTKSESTPVTDSNVIQAICEAEEKTQSFLQSKGLCFGCDNGCLPPYSIVLSARLDVENGFGLSCAELGAAWAPKQSAVEAQWATCVADIKAGQDGGSAGGEDESLPPSCPTYFSPTLVDEETDANGGASRYTSSIFATDPGDVDELYLEIDGFDRGDKDVVEGAYDTQMESFQSVYVDDSINNDMALAVGSAGVVAIAILVHNRSPFITCIGLLQIILSFPLSYFVYKLVAGLDFFPFLNFIGIFVVFALGAGDIFVAVDKFKYARVARPRASTEDVAAVALPDALLAMLLTTVTTALAFFATAICPVAPIKMFAIFCGLLILFDYMMNVLLVFPALCIYDRALMASGRHSACCCFTLACCGGGRAYDDQAGETEVELTLEALEEDVNPTLINRILSAFYYLLHRFRWPLAVACIAGFSVSIYFASTLQLPTSGEVRLLPESHELEKNFLWRQKLLSSALSKAGGSQVFMIWGVTPADTGDLNDPNSWTQLVLDDSFQPSSEQTQVDLLKFCEDLFEQDFASILEEDYMCPIKKFDLWLQEQAALESPDEIYTSHCAGATQLPVPQANFDPCVVPWTKSANATDILSRNGKVAIMVLPFRGRTRFDSPFEESSDEWNLIEDWVQEQNEDTTLNGYFTSFDFWWYDTNMAMLGTAYSAAAIALGCAAIVIFFSSRSIILTTFSVLTIGYVLTSVTATLVSLGWTLGFLESVCFAILIGVSVDFVIHLSHAYATPEGDVDRSRRTKFALISMGPSILSTALTTILSSIVMLFTVITFFQKFAMILFFTVIQASIGSFIVFLTMVECVGPSNPTYFADKVSEYFQKKKP